MASFEKHTLPLRITTFMAICVTSLLVGLILYNLLSRVQDWQISVTGLEDVPREIGGAGCFTPFYDKAGIKIEYLDVANENYLGPAPIYHIPPITSTDHLCGYPDVVTPSLALKGQTVYPLFLEVTIPRERLKIGESAELIAKASFGEHFSRETNSVYYAIPISSSETITVAFGFASPNFAFSPERVRSDIFQIDLTQSVSSFWIISPNENASGEQSLMVFLNNGKSQYPLACFVHVDVRPSSGLNPAIIALLSTLGTFIVGLISVIKVFPGIWTSYENTFVLGKRKKRPIGFGTMKDKEDQQDDGK